MLNTNKKFFVYINFLRQISFKKVIFRRGKSKSFFLFTLNLRQIFLKKAIFKRDKSKQYLVFPGKGNKKNLVDVRRIYSHGDTKNCREKSLKNLDKFIFSTFVPL